MGGDSRGHIFAGVVSRVTKAEEIVGVSMRLRWREVRNMFVSLATGCDG